MRVTASSALHFEPNGLVTLTTDFGTQDGYAGAMKGVVLAQRGDARLVDLTHDVPPQDVVAGAFALAQAARTFPAGTIHVAVVDPGVGSTRRPLVVTSRGSLFIGPDNGLLSLAAPAPPWGHAEARVIDRIPPDWTLSATFHGRDLFARVAGRILAGTPIAELASTIVGDPKHLDWPTPGIAPGELHGEVVHVDRFGNLITSVDEDTLARLLDTAEERNVAIAANDPGATVKHPLAGRFSVEIATSRMGLVTTYADVERGRLCAYVGSAGWLEIAVRDGSAAELLSAARHTPVRVTLAPTS